MNRYGSTYSGKIENNQYNKESDIERAKGALIMQIYRLSEEQYYQTSIRPISTYLISRHSIEYLKQKKLICFGTGRYMQSAKL